MYNMDQHGQNSQTFQSEKLSKNISNPDTRNMVTVLELYNENSKQQTGQNSQVVHPFSEPLEEKKRGNFCECCNYSTSNKSDYKKHLLTNKHITNASKELGLSPIQPVTIQRVEPVIETTTQTSYKCANCEKEFAIYNSYWKHTHRPCKRRVLKEVPSKTLEKTIDNTTALEILKQNSELATKNSELCELVLTMCKENKDLQKMLLEQNANNTMVPSIGNITNNTTINNTNHFNLNVFLNEQCKDAINLNTFLNDLDITADDYEQTGKLGYVENISRILINGLKRLDVYKRPIHCTDIKRETIYIKENDKWDKDNEKNEKIIGVVETIAERNLKTFPKWAALHPNHRELDSTDNKKCLELYKAALGSESPQDLGKEHNKIVKNVLKTVTIDTKRNKITE
jgi:DNA-directed RNA polymerase subunit RPC12/RpoP